MALLSLQSAHPPAVATNPCTILGHGRVFNDGCIALHSDDPPLPHGHGGKKIDTDTFQRELRIE